MQELNDSQLEDIVGGALTLPSIPSGNGSTSAGASVNASASGQHTAGAITNAQSISFQVPNGPSFSLGFGFAAAAAD